MHNFIRIVSLYASIMTLVSALAFVFYLEIYSLVTRDVMMNEDTLSWRSFVPKISMWAMIIGGLISAASTLLSIAGF